MPLCTEKDRETEGEDMNKREEEQWREEIRIQEKKKNIGKIGKANTNQRKIVIQ